MYGFIICSINQIVDEVVAALMTAAHRFDFDLLNLVYIKNSSVECDSGQVRFVRGRSIEISITRSPLSTGSVMFNPLGLYTSSFCIAM